MNSRTLLTVMLGIFWFLYPPKAYAECKLCQGKQVAQNETTEVKNWDTKKTTWDKKATPSDQPIKIKKKAKPTPSN